MLTPASPLHAHGSLEVRFNIKSLPVLLVFSTAQEVNPGYMNTEREDSVLMGIGQVLDSTVQKILLCAYATQWHIMAQTNIS